MNERLARITNDEAVARLARHDAARAYERDVATLPNTLGSIKSATPSGVPGRRVEVDLDVLLQFLEGRRALPGAWSE